MLGMDAAQVRKAQVVTALSALGLQYADGYGGAPVPRPFLGGLASGFHTLPRAGDQVAVLHETAQHPVATVSLTDTPASLPPLQPGESLIAHPGGAYLKFSNAGPVTLYVSGTLQMVFDPATSRVQITAAGGLYVNGTQVTVP